jgi:hypothetical protein
MMVVLSPLTKHCFPLQVNDFCALVAELPTATVTPVTSDE